VRTPAIFHAFQRDVLPAGADLLQADDPVTIGGHRLAGRLASSGTGVVYLARDRGARLVTVRTTHARTSEPGPVRARLRAEAACVRRLPSSCTAPLLHDGTDETPPYLVNGHIEGPSLERVVDVKGPLPAAMVAALATDLARVLAAVHDAGVVHGNLTPGNVVLTQDGLRVVDFGVAQEFASSGEPAEVGAVADNPGWLAPELLTGGPPGPACDVFGWGCLVAYAATGHSPHATVPARLDALEPALRRLVESAVAEDPAARVGTADLAAALDAPPDPADPPAAIATPAPAAVPHRPRQSRGRALVSGILTLAVLLVAIPAGEDHTPAPPKAPRPGAPSPTAGPRHRPASNTAALSAYDQPQVPARRARPERRRASRPPRALIWMTCSNTRPGWCSMTGVRKNDPAGSADRQSIWRITWTSVP
jgi:eukaryotic-like serine/threonine-protein kinase